MRRFVATSAAVMLLVASGCSGGEGTPSASQAVPSSSIDESATAWDGTQLEDLLARAQPIIDSIQFER